MGANRGRLMARSAVCRTGNRGRGMPGHGGTIPHEQLPVVRLLEKLARSETSWNRFQAEPELLLEEYGLCIPGGRASGRPLQPRRRPELQFVTPRPLVPKDSPEDVISQGIEVPGSVDWVETRLVRNGVKPAARLMLAEGILPAVLKRLESFGLCVLAGTHKLTLRQDPAKGRCSDLVQRRLPWWYPAPGYCPVYLSRDPIRAQRALLWEAVGADRELGLALGYPSCCVDRFSRLFPRSAPTQGDLIPFALRRTAQPPPFAFLINNLARCFNRRLIFHFPCHYQCPAAIRLGDRYLESLRSDCPEVASTLAIELCRPVLHAGSAGIFWMTEYSLQPGGGVAYDPARLQSTVSEGDLFQALGRADRLTSSGWPRPRLTLWRGQREVFQAAAPAWCVTFSGAQSANDSW